MFKNVKAFTITVSVHRSTHRFKCKSINIIANWYTTTILLFNASRAPKYEFRYLAWCGWSMIALRISFKGLSSLWRCLNKPRKHTRASSHWPRVRWLQNAVNSCCKEVSSSRSKGWLNGSCSLILGCKFFNTVLTTMQTRVCLST